MMMRHTILGSKCIMNLLIKTLLLVTFFARTCWLENSPQQQPQHTEQLVLFISFDGFRWDYLTKTDTPNFDRLTKAGVQAEYVYDAYITKTFPNHYTMITGLYEESHGIVANNMYDPILDKEFHIGEDSIYDPVWWKDGEPLWIANQRQGGHSGVINYIGADIKIRGTYPTYHLHKYDHDMPYNDRVDKLILLFASGSINLGVLYFEETDYSGHEYGPESDEILVAIKKCDAVVGYLIDELQRIDVYDKINIVITSDHGMAEVSQDKFVFLEDFINTNCCRIIENNPIVMLWPHDDSDVASIYKTLSGAHPHLDVFLREDIPESVHYTNNVRIPPIMAVGQENWMAAAHKINSTLKGEHGYNNTLMSMHLFFVAHGPSFKKGYKMKPFRNVDIYPLLCNLLGIEPAPNNGSMADVKMMLKKHKDGGEDTNPPTGHKDITIKPQNADVSQALSMQALIGLGTACFIALLAMFLLVAMCIRQRSYRAPAYEYMPIEDTSLEGQQALQGPHASYFYPNTKI